MGRGRQPPAAVRARRRDPHEGRERAEKKKKSRQNAGFAENIKGMLKKFRYPLDIVVFA